MHTAHCMQLKKIKLGKGMFAFHNFQQFFKNKSTEHAFTVQYMLCDTGWFEKIFNFFFKISDLIFLKIAVHFWAVK